MDNDILSVQNSALWFGQVVDDSGTTTEITWSLCLTPGSQNPTAFGASLSQPPVMLHGSCNAASKDVVLIEVSSVVIHSKTYYGSIVEKSDGVWIIGSWRDKNGVNGQFAIRREEINDDLHISGIWVGEAAPDPELAPFFIPTNPIRWCLSVIKKSITYM